MIKRVYHPIRRPYSKNAMRFWNGRKKKYEPENTIIFFSKEYLDKK